MSQWGVQLVIGRLLTDDAFRRRFEHRRRECLTSVCEQGVELNDAEMAALIEADSHVWGRMASRIDRRLRRTTTRTETVPPLTARQRRVLQGVFDGLTNKQIATALDVSEPSVKATLQQLFRKARVRSRAQLVRVAIRYLLCVAALLWCVPATRADAQTALTWPEIRTRFEASNPALQVDQLGVDELKAAEITAFLRPNPQCGVTVDQIGNTASTPDQPANIFSAATLGTSCSYLYERQHKRELRRDSARGATAVAAATHGNLDRTLLFALRSAFVQALAAKAALAFARDNLSFYDQALTISRQRLQAGDIAQVDLNRLELQRVQFESAIETADVGLRTAKMQLQMLLNDATPIDQFDVTGPFDFVDRAPALADLRRMALDTRPDLRAATESVQTAALNHRLAVANGSSDPTLSIDGGFPSISRVWQSYAPPLREFVGVGVAFPIRMFDRNQGEKLRTQIDITKNQRQVDVMRLQVLNDVDTAYATLLSTINLLRPYRERYLAQSTQVRDIVTQSYQRGGAALLDFLQAQQDYRAVQLSYISLVGQYLTASAQLNEAVGQEVIP